MRNYFKRLFRRKRYFLVSFWYDKGHGDAPIETNNGKYANRNTLVEYFINGSKIKPNYIIISNIIELSKRDYKDWIR